MMHTYIEIYTLVVGSFLASLFKCTAISLSTSYVFQNKNMKTKMLYYMYNPILIRMTEKLKLKERTANGSEESSEEMEEEEWSLELPT